MSLLNNSDMSVFVGFYLGEKATKQTKRFLEWAMNFKAGADIHKSDDFDECDGDGENELEYLNDITLHFADGMKAEIVTFMCYNKNRSNYVGAMYNDLVKHDPKLLTEFTYGVLHPDVITEYKTRLTAAVTAQFPELLTLPFEVKVMHH